jgi:hypothetical protein
MESVELKNLGKLRSRQNGARRLTRTEPLIYLCQDHLGQSYSKRCNGADRREIRFENVPRISAAFTSPVFWYHLRHPYVTARDCVGMKDIVTQFPDVLPP